MDAASGIGAIVVLNLLAVCAMVVYPLSWLTSSVYLIHKQKASPALLAPVSLAIVVLLTLEDSPPPDHPKTQLIVFPTILSAGIFIFLALRFPNYRHLILSWDSLRSCLAYLVGILVSFILGLSSLYPGHPIAKLATAITVFAVTAVVITTMAGARLSPVNKD